MEWNKEIAGRRPRPLFYYFCYYTHFYLKKKFSVDSYKSAEINRVGV